MATPTSHLAVSNTGQAVQSIHPGPAQVIATTAASAVNAVAFAPGTTVLRICASVAIHYRVGKGTPVAVAATDSLLPAGAIEYINICSGEAIAVVADGSSGNTFVTEGN
jgi:hypothetical protein